jgi:hypothetical protein
VKLAAAADVMEVVDVTVGDGVGERGIEITGGEVDEVEILDFEVVELRGVEVGPRLVVDDEVDSPFPPEMLTEVLVEPPPITLIEVEEEIVTELEVAEFLMYIAR